MLGLIYGLCLSLLDEVTPNYSTRIADEWDNSSLRFRYLFVVRIDVHKIPETQRDGG